MEVVDEEVVDEEVVDGVGVPEGGAEVLEDEGIVAVDSAAVIMKVSRKYHL